MQPRMKNPAMLLPDATAAVQALQKVISKSEMPPKLGHLVHLRASQINGCSACVDGGVRYARKSGESEERLATVAAWREAPYFTDAERAALALTECVTRLSDRTDPVPDAIWDEAKKHYSEDVLAAILLHIGLTNLYNRMNVPTRQPAGQSW